MVLSYENDQYIPLDTCPSKGLGGVQGLPGLRLGLPPARLQVQKSDSNLCYFLPKDQDHLSIDLHVDLLKTSVSSHCSRQLIYVDLQKPLASVHGYDFLTG